MVVFEVCWAGPVDHFAGVEHFIRHFEDSWVHALLVKQLELEVFQGCQSFYHAAGTFQY